MIRKIAVILLIIITIQFTAGAKVSAATPIGGIAAQSALLIERDSETILYDQYMNYRRPAGSFAKIMTLYLAAQAVETDEVSDSDLIEMTEAAWHDIDGSSTTQDILPGQVMTFIDLMYSAYVGNANEACNMIALHLAGSTERFAAMMNETAAQFGCENTNFVNPHGQHHEDQYTTAYDLYLMFSRALKSNLFGEISGTFRHVTEEREDVEARTYFNLNSMLNQNSIYYYRFCLSGFSTGLFEGTRSLVALAEQDGMALIAVVLGAGDIINDDESVTMLHFTEAYKLFMWGYENFGWRDILKTTDLLARVPVLYGSGADYVNVRPERALTLLLETGIDANAFDIDINIFSQQEDMPLAAPVSAGDTLGEAVVSRSGIIYDTIPLVANTDIELNGIEQMRRQIIDALATPLARRIITALIIVIVIYAALVIRYNVIRIKRLRKIRDAKNELIRERLRQNEAREK